MNRYFFVFAMAFAVAVASLHAAQPVSCPDCAEWNAPQRPFRVYANTWYVGPHGLSSILITSGQGHVLIDGGLSESAPQIAKHIRELGFRVEDIKLILNSHAHSDHAGGIAQLQRLSGAQVVASMLGARALERGGGGPEDPLTAEGKATPFPKVAQVRAVADGETLHVGDLAITAHLTLGHTPGSTSWNWDSCAHEACLHLAYVDSLNALDYKLIDNPAYPAIAQDFLHSFDVVAALPCDIVLSPHPGVVDMWKKLDRRQRKSVPDPFVDADACRNYARMFREDFEKKLARQQTSTP